MVTIIISSWKEVNTIPKCIKEVSKNIKYNPNLFEIIQVSPDEDTLKAGLRASKKYCVEKIFRQIKDDGVGKPAGLNLAMKSAKGSIIIQTDGDTYLGAKSIENMLRFFKNKNIGVVTGRPISQNSTDTFFGYIHTLGFDVAHKQRMQNINDESIFQKFLTASGYLMAFRNEVDPMPNNVLDDIYISLELYKKGYSMAYSPLSTVYVKGPANFKDYIKQKSRNIKGALQMEKDYIKEEKRLRNIKEEIKLIPYIITHPKNIKSFIFMIMSGFLRLYLWIYINILKNNASTDKGWERIESTK